MYEPVSRAVVRDIVLHLRELYRRSDPKTEQELREHQAREVFAKTFLSNLPRQRQHPTLHTVIELANAFGLTLDGAHRVFGYDLSQFLALDCQLNGDRTRIIESYSFDRDFSVDLPLRLGDGVQFERNAFLQELVWEWQSGVPIRSLEGDKWRQHGMFYIQVGMEDSLGAALSPGSVASVERISEEESQYPDPHHIYLLQFGSGYRCSGCVISGGRLYLTSVNQNYKGPTEFLCPGAVRIVGRVRMFAAELPATTLPSLRTLPDVRNPAPLILPWEQSSLGALLGTKERRFSRPGRKRQWVKETLEAIFQSSVSDRTERRYHRPGQSRPHVNVLLQMCLERSARYTDAVWSLRAFRSDRHRHALETLMSAKDLYEIQPQRRKAQAPYPEESWLQLRMDWGEWPSLLSMKFPKLETFGDQIIRLRQSNVFKGLDPLAPPGTLMLLERLSEMPDVSRDSESAGWDRPIYAVRTSDDVLCGYLEVGNEACTLVPHPLSQAAPIVLPTHKITGVSKVIGVACAA